MTTSLPNQDVPEANHELDQQFRELYRRTAEYHKSLIEQLETLATKIVKTSSLEDVANIRFVTYHLERLGTDIKKKINQLDQLAIKATSIRWLHSSVSGEPIRTDYATFSPGGTEVPNLPNQKEEPARYAECLRAMGVPDQAIADNIVSINWKALKEYRERLDTEGKPLPEAFGGADVMAYTCRVSHKKKEVLE